ncbi:MAG: hypothetical protein KDA96_20990, partial [Planctomycetaceae bacterium]|nr:hypothetical protein [Planctomycetaceae bacterium]
YQFTAKQGQRIRLRVHAASLGSPIDAALRIQRAAQTDQPPLLELDDSPLPDHDIFGTSFRGGGGMQQAIDPSVVWTAPDDGNYLLTVTDTSGAGGPTGIYRIEIEEPETMVQTVLTSGTFDWTESMRVSGFAIPRGNRWTVDVSLPAGQWNRIGTRFKLQARGLPAGMRLESPIVPADAPFWPVQLIADAAAPAGGGVFTLEAIPVSDDATVVLNPVTTRCQQNVPFINHPGGSAWRTVRTDRYVAGVTDPAPFSLEIDQPRISLVRGGELAIPVRIIRHNGFAEPVEIRCGGMPRSIATPPPTIIPGDQSEGVLQLGAEPTAPLQSVPLYVIGSTIRDEIDPFLGAGHIRVSSEIVALQVAEPWVELAAAPDSIRRGQTRAFVWTVRQRSPFAGAARVTLLGLPRGVSVLEPLPEISKDSSEVAFTLQATDEALLGPVNGLTCEVAVPVGDQILIQRTGSGTLRIDPRAE